jgi:hypothetical protein
MGGGLVVGAAIMWIVPIFVAVSQGRAKRREGWAYGLFLGWLGVIILALLPALPDREYGLCPWCHEDMKLAASVCPHCRRQVTPTT